MNDLKDLYCATSRGTINQLISFHVGTHYGRLTSTNDQDYTYVVTYLVIQEDTHIQDLMDPQWPSLSILMCKIGRDEDTTAAIVASRGTLILLLVE
jgi:hypothetical protein